MKHIRDFIGDDYKGFKGDARSLGSGLHEIGLSGGELESTLGNGKEHGNYCNAASHGKDAEKLSGHVLRFGVCRAYYIRVTRAPTMLLGKGIFDLGLRDLWFRV